MVLQLLEGQHDEEPAIRVILLDTVTLELDLLSVFTLLSFTPLQNESPLLLPFWKMLLNLLVSSPLLAQLI